MAWQWVGGNKITWLSNFKCLIGVVRVNFRRNQVRNAIVLQSEGDYEIREAVHPEVFSFLNQ